MSGSATGPTGTTPDLTSDASATDTLPSTNSDSQTQAQKLTQQISDRLAGLTADSFADPNLVKDLFNLRKEAMVEHNNLMKLNNDKDKDDRDKLLEKIRAIEGYSQVVNQKFPYTPTEGGADDDDIRAQLTRSAPEGFKYHNEIFDNKEGTPSTILGQMFQAGMDFVSMGWNVGLLTPPMMLASSAYTFVAGNGFLAAGVVAGTLVGTTNRIVNSVAKTNADPYFKDTKAALNAWSADSLWRKVLAKPAIGSLNLLNTAGNFVTKFKDPKEDGSGYKYKNYFPTAQRVVDGMFEQSARLDTTLRFDKIVTEGPGAWLHNSIFSKVFYSSVSWMSPFKIDDIPPGIINSMGGRDNVAELSRGNAVLYGWFKKPYKAGDPPAVDPRNKETTPESTASVSSSISEDDDAIDISAQELGQDGKESVNEDENDNELVNEDDNELVNSLKTDDNELTEEDQLVEPVENLDQNNLNEKDEGLTEAQEPTQSAEKVSMTTATRGEDTPQLQASAVSLTTATRGEDTPKKASAVSLTTATVPRPAPSASSGTETKRASDANTSAIPPTDSASVNKRVSEVNNSFRNLGQGGDDVVPPRDISAANDGSNYVAESGKGFTPLLNMHKLVLTRIPVPTIPTLTPDTTEDRNKAASSSPKPGNP